MGFELISVDGKEKRYSLELKKDDNQYQFLLFKELVFNGMCNGEKRNREL